jgi:hypothetical protein
MRFVVLLPVISTDAARKKGTFVAKALLVVLMVVETKEVQ